LERQLLYGGVEDPTDPGDYSRLKQIFFWAFADEYLTRLEWVNANIMTQSRLTSLAQNIAQVKWQYSEQYQALSPYDPSNDMLTCYNRSLSFINTRAGVVRAVKSSYNSSTTVSMCLDSPIVIPLFSSYRSFPGKSVAPIVLKDQHDPTIYTVSWDPANSNGYPIDFYEIYVRTDSSGPIQDVSAPIYNGSALSTTWSVPNVKYPTTFQFYVRAKNQAGYGQFSEPFELQYYTDEAITALTTTGAVWYYVGAIIAVVLVVVVIVVVVLVSKGKGVEPYKQFLDEPLK